MKERKCKKCGRIDNIDDYFPDDIVDLKGDLCERCKKIKKERREIIKSTFKTCLLLLIGLGLPFLAIYTVVSITTLKGIPYQIVMSVISTMHDITISQPTVVVSFAYFVIIAIVVAIVSVIKYIIDWFDEENPWF